jgi:translation initiation factor IF-3
VINDEGKQLGVMPIDAALNAARGAGLDLVEVAPEADPPVCRIMDFGRYKFQLSKKMSARKSSVVEIKEVKFRPKTDEHDYQFKLRHIEKFLAANIKTKVSLVFRGREIAHAHLGQQLMNRVIADLAEIGQPEIQPKLEGRAITMVIAPLKSAQATTAQDPDPQS